MRTVFLKKVSRWSFTRIARSIRFFTGELLGGHVRTVFTFITVLFILCIICTVTSFKEIPLDLLQTQKNKHLKKVRLVSFVFKT